ncbi:5-Nucleotidase [Seminavis robusta]|uniref:5-Nucleotidase n=1 Tax=Seminavis robusta TaxID=568900 RepID=A0A9N8DKT8_9STRA|nr:5-Nucleotidase [Seminavis robusta]|eukprot:Sro137_g064480.1 5-Nucleotidase (620) ;mRNA; r:79829-81688
MAVNSPEQTNGVSNGHSNRSSERTAEPLLGNRPRTANGTFLRILTINDVYKLENFPHFAAAVDMARALASDQDCVVASFLNGDFLSPSILTALDRGRALMNGVNLANIDYLCLGNHEFDIGFDGLESRLQELSKKTTLINSNVDDDFLSKHYPPFHFLQIGEERTAVVGGFLTNQIDIFPPKAKPKIRPIEESCVSTWEDAKAAFKTANNNPNSDTNDTKLPDLFLPMTHQLMHQDRNTATFLAQHEELKSRTPIILGGHDHEVYLEEVGQSIIAKVGVDAEKIGIIDVWWTADGQVKSRLSLVPCDEFPKDTLSEKYAQETSAKVNKLMSTPIASLPKGGGSTKKVRFEASPVASWLLSTVKRGLNRTQDKHIDCALIQAGGIRGQADYDGSAPFRVGDLYNEFAFETPTGIVEVPGWVLAESVQNTRSAAKPAPQFLHLDTDCTVLQQGDDHILTHVNGAPLVKDRLYRICTWNNTLNGVNDIQPLLAYVQTNVTVPDDEACRPAKDIVLEVLVVDAWRHLFELPSHVDNNCHSCVPGLTQPDIETAVDRVFAEMECAGDGVVNIDALYDYMESKGHRIYHGCGIAMEMMKLVDVEGKGQLSRDLVLEQLQIHACGP